MDERQKENLMSGIKLSDLPEDLRQQAISKLAQEIRRKAKRGPAYKPPDQLAADRAKVQNAPPVQRSKTEQAAEAMLSDLLNVHDWEYQTPKQVLPGNHIYTPDLYSPSKRLIVEIKGTHKFKDQSRSRLAFDMARSVRRDISFAWVERRPATRGKQEHWRIEVF